MTHTALLALEDGTLFWGISLGAEGETVGEVVFNTSLTGYQEILTDPSYYKQIVTLTYPHIGNVGVNEEDEESPSIMAQGLIVRDCPPLMSNFRAEKSLPDYLKEQGVVAISDIDTRKLTRILRDKGAQSGVIVAGENIDADAAIAKAKTFAGLKGMDLAKEVTTSETYVWTEGTWSLENGHVDCSDKSEYHVVAFDYGIKRNILRMLADRGCKLTVVPAKTPAADVLAMKPDGIFLSNGPGDPEPCDYAIQAIQEVLNTDIPVFGICLGHQLLALASGAKTLKMKFGHHGGNHPVQDLKTKKVMITAQNHGFAVDADSLPDCLEATHSSLFDGTSQGIQRKDKSAFSFQGHPEASPGPHDVAPLFDQFIENIKKYKQA
ncbi:glutamine-hydrolyzing carbamoyl-phosphate synthase small subunit [Hydrogenovibrio sp. 3SP14C1]|uniref:glutamine-hydrolyzing carbamoyl-phosphate synthase small subunit n=1 Tax=Hydrogenovibrio sp. 3SP14C1 TaxID=3038774 RepID=UPI002417BAC1|nr:glutamine-hydrolyzing carbamoyl-phosphate synthase small subunit [Hydrogenovibrio sp. 3SP14C1]MDG4813498.1 glutamine-hydrolyzing carbamoyl-phosphate synthase small subunit [Hydrogenovibrio sp. 3SP14C1]